MFIFLEGEVSPTSEPRVSLYLSSRGAPSNSPFHVFSKYKESNILSYYKRTQVGLTYINKHKIILLHKKIYFQQKAPRYMTIPGGFPL